MTTFTSHSSRLALPMHADSFFFLSVSYVQTPLRTCAVTDTPHKVSCPLTHNDWQYLPCNTSCNLSWICRVMSVQIYALVGRAKWDWRIGWRL